MYGVREAKSYSGYAHGRIWLYDLLGLRTVKSALSQLKNKSMNWANFIYAGSDGIIFD